MIHLFLILMLTISSSTWGMDASQKDKRARELIELLGDIPTPETMKKIGALITPDTNLRYSDTSGMTPLFWATLRGNLEAVKKMLALRKEYPAILEVDPTEFTTGRTPLIQATSQGSTEIVKALLDAHADASKQSQSGSTAASIAFNKGYTEIQELLKQEDKERALIKAIEKINNQEVARLINAGVAINWQDDDGNTPLMQAIRVLKSYAPFDRQERKQSLAIIQQLLEAQANPNIPSNNGTSPLLLAIEHGEREVVDALLKAQADPNMRNNKKPDGSTPLIEATLKGYVDIVQSLINANADPNITSSGRTALDYAQARYSTDIIKILKPVTKQKAPQQSSQTTSVTPSQDDNGKELVNAAWHKNTERVQEILKQGNVNVNSKDFLENTALLYAAENRKIEMVRALLTAGANPNIPNNTGATPLLRAVENNDIEIAKILLEAKADPTIRDTRWKTSPLERAKTSGSQEMKTLFNLQKTESSATGAATEPERSASPVRQRPTEQQEPAPAPWSFSWDQERPKSPQREVKIRKADEDESKPIPVAQEKPISRPASPIQVKEKSLDEQLVEAVENQELETVQKLLIRGARSNTQDQNGTPVLLLAVNNYSWLYHKNSIAIVTALLDGGATVNATDSNKNSALTLAAHKGDNAFDLVNLLIQRKADINHKDKSGESALEIAKNKRKAGEKILALLEKAAGKSEAPKQLSAQDAKAVTGAVKLASQQFISVICTISSF